MNTVEVRNEDIWTRATSIGSDTMPPRETMKAVTSRQGGQLIPSRHCQNLLPPALPSSE
jgi:hypothetical protein